MRRVDHRRIRILREAEPIPGPVVYWMSRDQRVHDNWALLYAQETALLLKQPLIVVFCLAPRFLGATRRQYGFMLRGLQEVQGTLVKKNIPFDLLRGAPEVELPRFLAFHNAGALITDFDPLRIKRTWKDMIARKLRIPFFEVDAHNITPCWIASAKQEFAAYTFRPKISRSLSDYCTDFPKIRKHPFSWTKKSVVPWKAVLSELAIDLSVPEVNWITPGEKSAKKSLRHFIRNKLSLYAERRNDPTLNGQSNLSAYLHFGHISAQRVALEVKHVQTDFRSKEAFLEELIVRRELSDNFCFYNEHYDEFRGFPAWAQKSLNKHRKDKREYVYTCSQFEDAKTRDVLWNAAQKEMVEKGKMHGYMRMYWAKKILEWTRSPEEAMKIAIYLNDRYELDGRDPNGYTGIAWSIGGVHDRAWGERPVFGKIRYMSYQGSRSKFNISKYIGQTEI